MLLETETGKTLSLPLNKKDVDKMGFKEGNVGCAELTGRANAALRPSGPGRREAAGTTKARTKSGWQEA